MLVLSRKKNEGILIKGKEGTIRIVLLDVDKGRARIGVEAFRGYTILREEIVQEVRDANRLSVMEDIEKIKGIVENGNK